MSVVVGEAAVARGCSRDRHKYIPVGCGGAVPGADAPASTPAQPPPHRPAASRVRPLTARAARAQLFAAWISNSAFESVGATAANCSCICCMPAIPGGPTAAGAAYRDVLAAVSKALFESRDACGAGDRKRSLLG